MLEKEEYFDIVVVGAGAAGLIAAGKAAEMGAKVLLLEKMEKAGKKLAITGKGRCNITNLSPMANHISHIYPNGRFLKFAYSTFFTSHTIELLERFGVKTVTERGDRVFPESNKAQDVVSALQNYCSKHHVQIRFNATVLTIEANEKAISAVKWSGKMGIQTTLCKAVIICSGGKSYPATGSTGDGYNWAKQLGHTINTPSQSLVPIETKEVIPEQLQPLLLKNAKAIVWGNDKKITEAFGDLQFTHFGLSGPIILTLSRIIAGLLSQNVKTVVSIDLKPALDDQTLDNRLLRDINENGKVKLESLYKLWLPMAIIPEFAARCNIDKMRLGNQINGQERKKIKTLLKDFRYEITGLRSFKEAIITSGGVATSELDSKTMASKLVAGLFFAGEIIDLDADTGGYNLQIAWSTGWVAGQSAATMCLAE